MTRREPGLKACWRALFVRAMRQGSPRGAIPLLGRHGYGCERIELCVGGDVDPEVVPLFLHGSWPLYFT